MGYNHIKKVGGKTTKVPLVASANDLNLACDPISIPDTTNNRAKAGNQIST